MRKFDICTTIKLSLSKPFLFDAALGVYVNLIWSMGLLVDEQEGWSVPHGMNKPHCKFGRVHISLI